MISLPEIKGKENLDDVRGQPPLTHQAGVGAEEGLCVYMCSVAYDSLSPMDFSPPGSSDMELSLQEFQGIGFSRKILGNNAGVGCRFLVQEMFPTKRSNLCLLHLLNWQVDSLLPPPPGKHRGRPCGPNKDTQQNCNKKSLTIQQLI